MRFFVAVTDYEWFRLHASKSDVEEVNFWRPSPTVGFSALQPGEILLFKLHGPRNYIAGGGFFTRFLSAESDTGRALWSAVSERLACQTAQQADPGPATIAAAEGPRYGQPALVLPRLGQGSFRVLVTDA